MPMTASDLLGNADTFRRAYPHWPHAEPAPVTCGPCDAGTCGTCARIWHLTRVYVAPDGVCAYGHRAPAERVIVMGRIATALVNGRASEDLAHDRLVLEAGCTPEGARAHIAAWQRPVTSFTGPETAYAAGRADTTEG